MPAVKEFSPLDISSHVIAGRNFRLQIGRNDLVFAKTVLQRRPILLPKKREHLHQTESILSFLQHIQHLWMLNPAIVYSTVRLSLERRLRSCLMCLNRPVYARAE
jgi:hypothetical protein